jgi:hypothetical protein
MALSDVLEIINNGTWQNNEEVGKDEIHNEDMHRMLLDAPRMK